MALDFAVLITLVGLFFCVSDGLLLTDPSVMDHRLTHVETLIQGLTQEVNALKLENADLKSNISAGRSSSPVYFSAYRKTTLTYSTSSQVDVVFDGVRSNFHNCYDPSNGRFTAPVKGFYVFSWEILTSAGSIFDTELLVNGVRYQLNDCNNLAQTAAYSSCTGVVPAPLEVGDVVHIRSTSGTHLHGGGWSSFSGWLVFEMS